MIETERLILRPWHDADREPFWAMACDPRVMAYLPPLTRAEADASVDRMISIERAHGHVFWALERKAEGDFIGFCGILPPRSPIFEHEIGWRLAHHAWGLGLAREAAEASLDWAWANLPVPAIMAITNLANLRSWGLMERLGMACCPEEDFDHPDLAEGDPLRPHILYRIHRPQSQAA
ncbi:GNAT family N-acetyltransferase [Novosphingobium sp. PASSN1]|uniref:GNAT family N-acetyltransferase n=1 Tax=Novosphingobium sp. PASSN1 TaxID=2015561 RepID=UPI000BD5AD5F|nr:GNAT family N-acetyltransferase [Novosphingobium sp. PASSN1]OYU36605.1 MAG: GNAT family N-acetyltransferase [Novosphingobium sp. PASSN1]